MKYSDCEAYLLNIPRFTKKTTTTNLLAILERLGNPQNVMKVVHVAGTNGKGSVCAFLNTMLTYCGKKTGLFTSPHLVRINERMRVNGEMISDEEFVEIFCQIRSLVEKMMKEGYEHPSFFEFLFLMAVLYFKKQQVEYAIFEVGLGGRLDATNVIERPQVSVITSISRDHTEILGETIREIAGEKAGIIKPGVPVVFYKSSKEAEEVVIRKARETGTKIYIVSDEEIKINKISSKQVDFSLENRYYRYDNVKVNFPAAYQAVNASLALCAFEILSEEDKTITYKEHPSHILHETCWEGRMEQVRNHIFLDGAHNLSGITEFLTAVRTMECRGKRGLLFSAVADKDYEHIIAELLKEPLWDKVYVAQLKSARGVKGEELLTLFQRYAGEHCFVTGDTGNTVEMFCRAVREMEEEDMLFCAGSLYLVGEIKGYLEVNHD